MDSDALLCNICPKAPHFSDVSHLLTHVSSKAHLSHYFKLQVRSHQETHAGELLREYDQWYEVNNLANLLSDRMASKEARKRKSQGASATRPVAHVAKRSHEYKSTPAPAPTPSDSSLPDFLDPRLSDSYLNAGPPPGNGDISLGSNGVASTLSPTVGSNTHLCPDYPQPPTLTPERSLANNIEHGHQAGLHNGAGRDLRTPKRHRALADREDTAPRLLNGGLEYDPFVDGNDAFDCLGGSEGDRERADEIARLKGVLWPGMDIFDSATEQMRRKRNQKKDENILKMMEKTSICVEPTELIFSPTGILRKQRVISGNVEDSSPLKGESPIPKRRVIRPKRALLSQTDPNVPRGHDRKRAKKTSSYNLRKHSEEPSQLGLHASPTLTSLLPPPRSGYYPAPGESEELELSVRAFERRPGNGLAVYHDEERKSGPDSKDRHQETGLRLSSVPFSHGLPRIDGMAYGPFHPSTSESCVSNPAGRSYFAPDKENIEPLVNSHGGGDPIVGWSSPFPKRRYGNDAGCPPQYFVNDPQRAGFRAFDGHGIFSGYSCNPLAASFPRAPADENHIYAAETATDKSRPESVSDSPDATISDIEQDDFERLYLDGSSY